MDRDINAAINIRNFALRDSLKNLSTDATSGIDACGIANDVRDESQTSSNVEARKNENNSHPIRVVDCTPF